MVAQKPLFSLCYFPCLLVLPPLLCTVVIPPEEGVFYAKKLVAAKKLNFTVAALDYECFTGIRAIAEAQIAR